MSASSSDPSSQHYAPPSSASASDRPTPAPAPMEREVALEPEIRRAPPLNVFLGFLILLLAVFLLLWLFSQRSGLSGGGSQDKSLAVGSLESELALARAEVSRERSRVGLNAGMVDVPTLVLRIRQDLDELAGLVEDSEGQLQALRETNRSIGPLARQNEQLRRELDEQRGAKSQLAASQSHLAELEGEIAALRQQLARASSPGSDQELAKARGENARLQEELARAADPARLNSLQKLVEELQVENQALRERVATLLAERDGQTLFVERETLQNTEAKLIAELSALEGQNAAQLKMAYERLDADLGARVVSSVGFREGESTISQDRVGELQQTVANALAGTSYLVVGYASTTGTAELNRELARERAVRVASTIHQQLQGRHPVKAIYFGETSRFSPPVEANQVCELWELRP